MTPLLLVLVFSGTFCDFPRPIFFPANISAVRPGHVGLLRRADSN